MVRRATRKERKRYTRKRNDIILIAAEGKNKTEKNYFQEFNRSLNGCNIVFSNGNNTDPVKIVNDAVNTAKTKGVEVQNGDLVYAVFDTDFNKESQIKEARKLADKNGVELILSNPCFEVWLLLHFRYSTRGYQSNHEVLNELNNLWPAYHKSINSFRYLHDRCELAADNARRLKRFSFETKGTEAVEKCNPSTDVYRLVSQIIHSGDNSHIQ